MLMVTQFGDLNQYIMFDATSDSLVSIPTYIDDTFGWSYASRWWAYGLLWVFILLQLLLIVIGLGRINYVRR